MSVTRLLVGLIAGVPLALVGLVLRCLTLTGAMTLVVLGGLVFGGGGWTWGLLIIAVLVGRYGVALHSQAGEKTPRNWLIVVAVWGTPALAAIIYGASQHTVAWAAFIGATAFAAIDETMPTDKSSPAFSLVMGTLTGVAMLVLHDLAAVRRGLPTGWIDLWLVPMGVVGALVGVAVRTQMQRWLRPDLARLLGSMGAAVVTAIVGQSGWQLLGPIL